MPSYIVKPEREVDFYFYWSTVVDCPTAWGTRAEMEALRGIDTSSERFERADATGTSSVDGFEGWEEPFPVTEFWVREIGPDPFIVKRENMRAFCLSLDPYDSSKFDASLIEAWIPEEEES